MKSDKLSYLEAAVLVWCGTLISGALWVVLGASDMPFGSLADWASALGATGALIWGGALYRIKLLEDFAQAAVLASGLMPRLTRLEALLSECFVILEKNGVAFAYTCDTATLTARQEKAVQDIGELFAAITALDIKNEDIAKLHPLPFGCAHYLSIGLGFARDLKPFFDQTRASSRRWQERTPQERAGSAFQQWFDANLRALTHIKRGASVCREHSLLPINARRRQGTDEVEILGDKGDWN